MPRVNRKNPTRCASSDSSYSLMEFMADFPDDEACLQWLWKNRLASDGEHTYCPKCQETRKFARYATKQQRQSWTCEACGHHLHPTAGTIFHKSATSLHLWFYAMYLMTSTRCGISAKQLGREIGVTYKCAWRIFNRLRTLFADDGSPISGLAEIDESYFGGKMTNKHLAKRSWQYKTSKTGVLGIMQRSTEDSPARVVASVFPLWKGYVHPHIKERVMPATVVFTDESTMYDKLRQMGYEHGRVHHTQKIYVSGLAHTNTLEGFWSLAKRGISGVYHNVSAKFLQNYLNEYAWRYNHKEDPRGHFMALLSRVAESADSRESAQP